MLKSVLEPTPWLRQLAQCKPAKWSWGRAIRAGICIPLPLAIGFLTDNVGIGVWMSIATLGLAPAEGEGSYRSRFKMVALVTLIGSLGCLVGYLAALPWIWVVLGMALLAFVASVVSSYGAPYSLGTLQTLVLASIALGLPQIAPFWEPSLYYLCGGVFYMGVLSLEALLLRSRPQREAICALIDALAALAQGRLSLLQTAGADASSEDFEARRRAVTERISDLYTITFERRLHNSGRTTDIDMCWAVLRGGSTAFASIVSSKDADELERCAQSLKRIAGLLRAGERNMPRDVVPEGNGPLVSSIRAIAIAGITSHSPFSPIVTASLGQADYSGHRNWRVLLDRLIPGKDAAHNGLVLSLCVGLSYAIHWINDSPRWYWVPLTVALVMKPDFGSVFARSLLRSAGTLVGVFIGSLFMIYLPKDMLLIAVMAVFSALLPWANQRSYALMALFVTPVVLVLVDLSVPGIENIDYASQRFWGTVVGSLIVLVFGYFIWPRRHFKAFSGQFGRSAQAIAAYLRAVSANTGQASQILSASDVSRSRRLAYASLKDMRVQLQRAMTEPPPVGAEAVSWQPLIASAERICDQITAYSVAADSGQSASDPARNERLAAAIEQLAVAGDLSPETLTDDKWLAQSHLIVHVLDELRFITHSTNVAAGAPAAEQALAGTA